MNILFVGYFEPEYNRVAILIEGFKKKGINVNICRFNKRKGKLSKAEWKKLDEANDLIMVPSFAHINVPYVKANTTKPLIFDPLVSRYQTRVVDYKEIGKYSFAAFKAKRKDRRAFLNSDYIMCDTRANANYYKKHYGVPEKKIFIVPVGIRGSEVTETKSMESDNINIGFYGLLNPLQGVDKIVKAASYFKGNKNIKFTLIGTGFCQQLMLDEIEKHQLDNIDYLGKLSYPDLINEIKRFDICLGIFGDTEKARQVIPNKVFHYAGLNKCIITQESEAIKEIFTHNKDIVLCRPEPKSIAEKIEELISEKERVTSMAHEALETIKGGYTSEKLVEKLLDDLTIKNVI